MNYRKKTYGPYVWMDREFIKLPFTDEEFTLYLLDKLEDDIREVYDQVDKIVVVMHHIPFRQMVTYKLNPE